MFKKIVVCGMALVSLFNSTIVCNELENEWMNYNNYIEDVVIDHVQDMEETYIDTYYTNNEMHVLVYEEKQVDSLQVKTDNVCVQEIVLKDNDYSIYSVEVKTTSCNDYYKANTYSTAIELAQPLFVSESKCQEMLEQWNKYQDHMTEKTMVEYKTDNLKTSTSVTLLDYVQTF